MIQKIVSTILILFIYSSFQAQYAIKIKKEDNRFLFFQIGQKSDTIFKNKTDLFFIKLPSNKVLSTVSCRRKLHIFKKY